MGIHIPAVDDNTITLIDFRSGDLKDYANKVSYTKNGSAPNIIKDDVFGYVFRGNASTWYKSTNSWSNTDSMTLEFWLKFTGIPLKSVMGFAAVGYSGCMLATAFYNRSLYVGNWGSNWNISPDSYINDWHHYAVVVNNRAGTNIFIDGKLVMSNGNTQFPSSQIELFYIDFSTVSQYVADSNLYFGAIRFSNCARYTSNFNPYDTWHKDKQGIIVTNNPLSLLDKTKVKGFTIAGIQPANTNRKVAFKVDNKWNKLTTDGALSPLPTQAITSDSVLAEGNTVAELTAFTNVPSLAGKLVYPAIALYASEEAEVMPTFGMTVNATTDRNKNSISSQVYHISDTEITITDITVNKKIVGNAGINIVASIKNSSGWSFYTDIDNIVSKKATDIKFIYTFYVKECNEKNSARLIDIAVNYDQDNPVMTLVGNFKISPLILCINEKENGLTHYKFDYVEEVADTTNGKIPRRCFARRLYKVSS